MSKLLNYLPHSVLRLFQSIVLVALCSFVASMSAQTSNTVLSVTTFAGQPGARQSTDGTAGAARFFGPSGLTVGSSGNLVVADAYNHLIRSITSGAVVTTPAGRPMNVDDYPINIGVADGTGASAQFYFGLAITSGGPYGEPTSTLTGAITMGRDSSGNTYFADSLNHTIRKMTPAGSVTTIAGAAGQSGTADGTSGAARFFNPTGVAVDGSGNIYVADSLNYTIRKITPAGVVTTIAGVSGYSGNADGVGTTASFGTPIGIAIDSSGVLYVTDNNNNTVRRIGTDLAVTTLAGTAGVEGSSDGSSSKASFKGPTGIAVDSAGRVFVVDTGNGTIRMIAAGTVTTVAGVPGAVGSADGAGNAVRFSQPYGITTDASGSVFVSDTGNNTVRKATLTSGSSIPTVQITSQPRRQLTNVGKTVAFSITATGSSTLSYQWLKDGIPLPGASSSTYTITSAQKSDNGAYAVIVSSSVVSVTSSSAQLSVYDANVPIDPVYILSQPSDVTTTAGLSATFTIEIAGAPSATIQWRKNGVAIPGATAASYTVTNAQSSDAGLYDAVVTDGSFSVSSIRALLTVQAGSGSVAPSISAQPSSQTVGAGSAVSFTVSASGVPVPALQWYKNGIALIDGSTISGSTTATLTIGNTATTDAGTYTVRASNSVGSVLSNPAVLTVNQGGPSGPSAWLSNLSVRAPLNAGQTLTVGLTTTGGAKNVLVRGAGPALVDYGVSNAMVDPRLDLYIPGASSPLFSNNDWDSSLGATFSSVGAFPFPAGSKDAAFVRSLDGRYTVLATGTGAGAVLVEAYALNASSSPRLINISTLNFAGTGDNILIAGFVIGGSGTKKLLIRGIGPRLGDPVFGVTGVMANPKIELYKVQNGVSTKITENDDWDASLAPVFTSAGAFDLIPNSKDAALVATLDAGPWTYSVQLKGADGGTGQALIEVYELP